METYTIFGVCANYLVIVNDYVTPKSSLADNEYYASTHKYNTDKS